MFPVRLSLGVLAFFGLALAAACGSSSSGTTAAPDGGASDDGSTVSPGDDSGAAAANPLGMLGSLLANVTCGPLSGLAALLPGAGGGGGGEGGPSNKCGSGQTCCTMVMIPSISASCVAVGSCSGTSNECNTGADCSSGQVCCSGSADGGSMAATDAAAPAGLGGLAGGLSMFLPSTSCQSSCSATQAQQCASDTECPMGQTCNAAAGGMAGLGGLAGGLMPAKTCGTPPPEAGTTMPAMDSGMTTTMTPEASVDAPAE